MRLALRLLAIACAVAVIAFALANRAPVTVSLAPLPVRIDVPVYLLVLASLAAGVLAGGTASWIVAGRRRRAERNARRQLAAAERALVDARTRHAGDGAGLA